MRVRVRMRSCVLYVALARGAVGASTAEVPALRRREMDCGRVLPCRRCL